MKQKTFNNKLLDIFTVLETLKKELYKEYPEEIEYLYITHLLRTATLRLLEYNDTLEYLLKIVNIISSEFPNWKKNKYYQKSSKKLKIICNLAYKKQYLLLKIIKHIKKK